MQIAEYTGTWACPKLFCGQLHYKDKIIRQHKLTGDATFKKHSGFNSILKTKLPHIYEKPILTHQYCCVSPV